VIRITKTKVKRGLVKETEEKEPDDRDVEDSLAKQ
jgi:hypothetical protein